MIIDDIGLSAAKKELNTSSFIQKIESIPSPKMKQQDKLILLFHFINQSFC